MSIKRTVFITLAVILAAPILAVAGFWLYLIISSWLAIEIVSEQKYANGEVLRVTQKMGGPVGPQYAYELSHQSAKSNDFEFVSVWERPPGNFSIEVYEVNGLLMVVPPGRDVVHVRTLADRWQHWRLREMMRPPASAFQNILIATYREPEVMVTRIDEKSGQIHVQVELKSWPSQLATLEPSADGENINIVEMIFPTDPRASYAADWNLPDDTILMSVVIDLNNDGVAEILVSHPEARNGRAGNIWSVYVLQQETFKRLEDMLFMRTDAISRWPSNGADGRFFGITTYHPASVSEGSLVTYTLEGEDIVSQATAVNTNAASGKLLDDFMNPGLLVPIWHTPVSSLHR